MTKTRSPLPQPTPALVRAHLAAFDAQGTVTELALQKLLTTFPASADVSEVLLKVIVINRIYSTSIFAVQPVAEMVAAAGIDGLLAAGDPEAVERIRRVSFVDGAGRQHSRSTYSFATKYCALHNPRAYVIYDGLVTTTLWEYQAQGEAEGAPFHRRFKWDELKDYTQFKAIVEAFREHHGLSAFSLRELDQFLWTLGKEQAAASA